MALDIGQLQIHYSGNSGNETPALSLGGGISTATNNKVLSQSLTETSGITGVDSFDDGYSNPEGSGVLKWDGDSNEMSWKPFSVAQYSAPTIITTAGTYQVAVGDANGYVVVTVTQANLPGSGITTDDVLVADLLEKTFDDVSALESLTGLIEYRCFYIKNTSGTDTANSVTIWIESQPSGPDELDITADLVPTANEVAEGPLALETTEPTVDLQAWSRPSTQVTGIVLGTLAAGQYVFFWERRTVAAETSQKALSDKSSIGISAVSA